MRYIISLVMASLGGGAAQAEVPRVVTDIPPVHSLVAQVMGDLGTPELLLARGADEHDFQLRPSQAAALNDAEMVFWIGPELTPWLERGLEGAPETVVQVGLLQGAGTVVQGYMDMHDGHDHVGMDPHAWLSPANAQAWVRVIAAELGKIDPENAAIYAANAKAAGQTIAAADARAQAILAPVKDRPFVVFHDAFGYYVAHYGLTIAGTLSAGDAAAPGAARLVDLRKMVEGGGAVCLFPEVQHDAGLMDQIAEGTSVRIGGALDPVGSTYDTGPQMYAELITDMAMTMAECLSGG